MRIITISLLFIITGIAACKENFIDLKNSHAHVRKQKRMQFCYISFVTIDGTTFLVKQKRSASYILAVVHDVFAASIAHELDPTLAHQVAIIPAFHTFPGKIYDDWPATIHTLAPGKTIKNKIRSPYRRMNIKQAFQGLRRDMLPWMAKHIQIAQIVALDIFLCNHDRHRGNLFYDETTNTFCAIDMDSLYKYNLAECAYQNLLRMAEHDLFPLTSKELQALVEVKKTLEFLVHRYSAQDLLNLFDSLLDAAGLGKDSWLHIPRVEAEIELNRGMIRYYYKDVKKLIEVLDDVIKKASD